VERHLDLLLTVLTGYYRREDHEKEVFQARMIERSNRSITVEVLVYSDQQNRLKNVTTAVIGIVISSLYARFRANGLGRETSPQRIFFHVSVGSVPKEQ
jgi:hypothetical protein